MSRVLRCAAPALVTAAITAAAVAGAGPAQADDAGFLRFLAEHGYTGLYAGGEPIPQSSVLALGHMVCENLHVGVTVELQQPNYPAWPQFPLIADAAQRELCPSGLR
ncbi:DUF732 domain-containing protein [Mycobacterium sp. M1]|uniref:DUF732 domain-containing protein n=1 Tax=Mycolicibacter acidiphilus TaxID=2835306 RepID=A0ABS5RI72_9MYCO|nr:DUF732 domain-containing protein [Mycolicibacter acidiphilus]MBS9532639.1 DUF732 domain-containing protein [Mycolicibacter acidiphilus]